MSIDATLQETFRLLALPSLWQAQWAIFEVRLSGDIVNYWL